MCRFLVYKGSDEILLSNLILDPTHSILKQSFDSRLRIDTRRGQNNADGFGVGFYTDHKLGDAPCLFRSTMPAWNCPNLDRLAKKTASRLIFAHVRASTGGGVNEENCHPFSHGSLMWMHNGGLGGWKHIKRQLAARLADKWYHTVQGGTDSEWAFALFLDTLERLGCDPSAAPDKGFGPAVLRKAMLRTIAIINELTDAIPESVVHADNVDTRSLLNFALSDGHSVICTRYISSTTDQAASLYYSSGSQWEVRPSPGDAKDYRMQQRDKGADVVLVASEPLTFERENWVNVPTNSILTIHGQTVMVHPIIDAYSNRGPAQTRSAAYVQAKGLQANEKMPSVPTRLFAGSPALHEAFAAATAASSSCCAPDLPKKGYGPTIPLTLLRSRSPAERSSLRIPSEYSTAVASSLANITTTTTTQNDGTISSSSATMASAPASLMRQPSTAHSSSNNTTTTTPAQGNIKKKRMSLNELEHTQNLNFNHHDPEPMTPLTPAEPPRNSYGDPNKIAQFFPELSIST